MAAKKDIVKDIRALYGNVLSESKVAAYLGKSRQVANRELFNGGVPSYKFDEKNRSYLALDVAEYIVKHQESGSFN